MLRQHLKEINTRKISNWVARDPDVGGGGDSPQTLSSNSQVRREHKMSNIINAIKFCSNKNNVRIVKAILSTQGRIANIIVDRVHLAATLADQVVGAKNDPDALLDLVLPGVRQQIEDLHQRVNYMHQEDSREQAAEAISLTGKMKYSDAKAFLDSVNYHGEIVDRSNAVLTNARVIFQDELLLVLLADNGKFYASTDAFRESFRTR